MQKRACASFARAGAYFYTLTFFGRLRRGMAGALGCSFWSLAHVIVVATGRLSHLRYEAAQAIACPAPNSSAATILDLVW